MFRKRNSASVPYYKVNKNPCCSTLLNPAAQLNCPTQLPNSTTQLNCPNPTQLPNCPTAQLKDLVLYPVQEKCKEMLPKPYGVALGFTKREEDEGGKNQHSVPDSFYNHQTCSESRPFDSRPSAVVFQPQQILI